jgi:tetratricopeptide (TPR) repeat protein
MNHLAVLLWRKGEYKEAEALLRESLALHRTLPGVDPRRVSANLSNLGNVLADKGAAAEAEALYREALALDRRLLGSRDPDLAKPISTLAIVLQDRGAYGEAEPLFREAVSLHREALGSEHPHLGRSTNNLGSVLEDKGDYAGAEPLYRESLAIKRKSLGKRGASPPRHASTLPPWPTPESHDGSGEARSSCPGQRAESTGSAAGHFVVLRADATLSAFSAPNLSSASAAWPAAPFHGIEKPIMGFRETSSQ